MYKIDLSDNEKEYIVNLLKEKETNKTAYNIKDKIINMEIDMRDTCWNCGGKLCWECDYDYADFGYDEEVDEDGNKKEGIVQILHCINCNAEIEYRVPVTKEDIEELKGEISDKRNN